MKSIYEPYQHPVNWTAMTILKFSKNINILSSLFADKTLPQKAKMNAIAAALDYGTRLVTGFLVTPFLVAGLGDVLYGVWRTLVNLTGYLSAASGRPSQALKWTTANLQHSTDFEEKRRNVASALIVWFLFLPFLATLGGLLAWFAPTWIKGLAPSLYPIVRFAAVLLMTDMIATTLTVLPQAVLEGENLAYKRMGLSASLVVVGGGLAVLALYLGTGLVGVAVAELFTTLVTGTFFLLVARKYIPWFGLARPAREAIRQFFGLSGWFLLWRLVMQLMTASDLLILGMFTSAELVTTYALTKYAPEALVNIVDIVVFGVAPGLGGIIGSGDLRKAARVRAEVISLTWLITVTLGSTILLWNRLFVDLWVGAQRYAGPLPNLLIVLLIAQFVLIRNDASIIDLTLNISRKVLLGFISALVSIATAALLVGFYKAGTVGLVLGLLAGRSILSIAYPVMIGRFLDLSFLSQLRGVVRPVLVSCLLFAASMKLDSLLAAGGRLEIGWVGLVLLGACTGILVLLLAFFLGLSPEQQKRILQRAQMALATPAR